MSSFATTLLQQVPPQWASTLRPTLQRSDEMWRAGKPLISYYLATYVAFVGMGKLKQISSPDEKKALTPFVMKTLDVLEAAKKSPPLAEQLNPPPPQNPPDGRTELTRVALTIFQNADNAEHEGQVNETIVRQFYTASVLLEATKQFTDNGQLDPIAGQKHKYAQVVATRMQKSLKSGGSIPYESPSGASSQGGGGGGGATAAAPGAGGASGFATAQSQQQQGLSPQAQQPNYPPPQQPQQQSFSYGAPPPPQQQQQGFPQQQQQQGFPQQQQGFPQQQQGFPQNYVQQPMQQQGYGPQPPQNYPSQKMPNYPSQQPQQGYPSQQPQNYPSQQPQQGYPSQKPQNYSSQQPQQGYPPQEQGGFENQFGNVPTNAPMNAMPNIPHLDKVDKPNQFAPIPVDINKKFEESAKLKQQQQQQFVNQQPARPAQQSPLPSAPPGALTKEPAKIAQAQKACRYAISALEFYDANTAKMHIRNAMQTLSS